MGSSGSSGACSGGSFSGWFSALEKMKTFVKRATERARAAEIRFFLTVREQIWFGSVQMG